jgi:hypothetical protein
LAEFCLKTALVGRPEAKKIIPARPSWSPFPSLLIPLFFCKGISIFLLYISLALLDEAIFYMLTINNNYCHKGNCHHLIGDKCNYHILKEGIEHIWEDPMNENGGKWVLTITKKVNNKSHVDEFWLFTFLAVIGETIDFAGDMVCGAVLSI